ncbi:MAG: thiamine diphosphokinase [Christensenellaceae bacterium]|nr:thiamine diphosphokinase [Christensenellaceae bacterium]
MKTAALILNSPEETAPVTERDVICADGGLRHAKVVPVAVIGDFDSLSDKPENLNYVSYPVEKNATDGQLAIDYAKEHGYDAVTIYGALKGKPDHVLGNLGLLKYAHDLDIDAVIKEKDLSVRLVYDKFNIKTKTRARVSLFPFFGDAVVRSSHGLYYPLENLRLKAGTNRGLSNVATDDEISLDVSEGYLLLFIFN